MIKNKFKYLILSAVLLFSLSSSPIVYSDETTTTIPLEIQELQDQAYTKNPYIDNTKNMTEANMIEDNIFVIDDGDVFTTEQELSIYKTNKNVLENLKDKPQLVVITMDYLPKDMDMDTYRYKTFEKLGIGQKGIDNGLLLILAKENRPDGLQKRGYGLEVGYGLEGIITDNLETSIFSSEVLNDFRNEDFSNGLLKVVSYLEKRLVNSELGNNQTNISKKEKEISIKASLSKIFGFIFKGLVILFFSFSLTRSLKKLYMNKVKKEQGLLMEKVLFENNLSEPIVIKSLLKVYNKKEPSEIFKIVEEFNTYPDYFKKGKSSKDPLPLLDGISYKLFKKPLFEAYNHEFKKILTSKINKSYNSEYLDIYLLKEVGIDFKSMKNSSKNIIKECKYLEVVADKVLLETCKMYEDNNANHYYIEFLSLDSKQIKEGIVGILHKEISVLLEENKPIKSDFILKETLYNKYIERIVTKYTRTLETIIKENSEYTIIEANVRKVINEKGLYGNISREYLLNILELESEKFLEKLDLYNKSWRKMILEMVDKSDNNFLKSPDFREVISNLNLIDFYPVHIEKHVLENLIISLGVDHLSEYIHKYIRENSVLYTYKPFKIETFEAYTFNKIGVIQDSLILSKEEINKKLQEITKLYHSKVKRDTADHKEHKEELKRQSELINIQNSRSYYNSSSSSGSSSSFGGGSSGGGGMSGGW